MSSGHQFGRQAYDWTISGAVITDPGNGGTIPIGEISFGVCELTIANAAETRVMPPLTLLKTGVRFSVVANQITGSGTCVIDGVTLSTEGQRIDFLTALVNGSIAWTNSADAIATVTATDLVLNSTNEINVTFDGVSALAIDDAAITGNVGVDQADGKSVFIETQDGGEPGGGVGMAGADFTLTAGLGNAAGGGDAGGGAGGCLSFVTQAGGAGDGSGATGAGGVIRLISDPGAIFTKQAAPTAETATSQTYTAAELMGGLITSTQSGAVTGTLDTGAAMDTAIHDLVGANEAFDWSLINIGSGSGTVTVTASSGHTIVGLATVAINTSAMFRSRRTAANTWVTYRIN